VFVNESKYVKYTPLVTVLFLESANVEQIYRMWSEQTAAGQSLLGWFSVWCALVLWANYYRVIAPKENRSAFWVTMFGIGMNSVVMLTVIYFRYLRGAQ